MNYTTPDNFIQNCYEAYKDGKLDAINPTFRKRAEKWLNRIRKKEPSLFVHWQATEKRRKMVWTIRAG